jgi:hypothetical protein
MSGEPETYLVAHIREALARDPRTNELHVDVTVSGGRLFLTGPVTTDEHRKAVGEVVAEVAPDYEVCNETTVAAVREPHGAEDLS